MPAQTAPTFPGRSWSALSSQGAATKGVDVEPHATDNAVGWSTTNAAGNMACLL